MAINFGTLTANARSDAFSLDADGSVSFYGVGDFAGGTLTLQFSIDGGTTWYDLKDDTNTASLTGSGILTVCLKGPILVAARVTGAGSPTIQAGILT